MENGEEKKVTGRIKGAPIYVDHWDQKRYRFFVLQHHSGEWTAPDKVKASLPYTASVDFTKDPDAVKKALKGKGSAKDEPKKKSEPARAPG